MAIVDTHAHIYSEDTDTYPQSPEPYLPPPGRGTIEDLKNEVKANGIDRVVVVQTFTVYQHDNRLTIDTVRENQEWATGVMNLDPFDDGSVGLMEEAFAIASAEIVSLLAGQRTTPSSGTSAAMGSSRLDVVLCALLNTPNCRSLAGLLEAYPNVPVVLDHCANLNAADFPDSDNLENGSGSRTIQEPIRQTVIYGHRIRRGISLP